MFLPCLLFITSQTSSVFSPYSGISGRLTAFVVSYAQVDKAATRITEEVEDENANIIFGSALDESMNESLRVSIVATGIEDPQY